MKLVKIIFITLLSIILIVILSLKPIFNLLEKSSVEVFNLIDEAVVKGDYKKVKTLVISHKAIESNQQKILSLLPDKYLEYFLLKTEVFDKYYSAFDKFVLISEVKEDIKETYKLKNDYEDIIFKSKEGKINAMDAYIALNSYLAKKENIKKYYQEQFIDKDLYDSFIKNMDISTDIYNLLNDVVEGKIELKTAIGKIDDCFQSLDYVYINNIYDQTIKTFFLLKENEWVNLYLEADRDSFLVSDLAIKNNLKTNLFINKYEKTEIDFDGDGIIEKLATTNTLIAYDENNKELARLLDYFPIPKPIAKSGIVYNPKNDDKSQFVVYDFQLEDGLVKSMLFGMFELKTGGYQIRPVCKITNPTSINDCYFDKKEIGL